ncbi:MAG: hypothetical protein KR126chlam5_01358 [Candidatus Anoxychlamydiales bacterium]|nr:hypothetical protein [Candidatus Anoxychlamydiales bacterium]
MSIIPQTQVHALTQPAQVFIDTSIKETNFGSEFNGRKSFIDPAKDFTNYLERVHNKYKDMNTTSIESLVNKLFQKQDPTFMNFVREKTYLRDTLKNRLFGAKTPLGEVLQELQNSQESPNRKLLSKETFNKAEKEAIELTKKEMALATEKRERREVSNEISYLQKRQTSVEKIGSEFQINTNIADTQEHPTVASFPNGNFVVTWDSSNQDGSFHGVYGQIFNRNNTKIGNEFRINTYTLNIQSYPSVTSLNDGNFIVIWQSYGQDGDIYGIYGQLFNGNGSKIGSEFLVNTNTINAQQGSFVTTLQNGNFITAWQSYLQDGSSWGVFGQLFAENSSKIGNELNINTYTNDVQGTITATGLSNGNFVATWVSKGPDGSLYGVSGQLFTGNGSKVGNEFQVNTYTIDDQKRPRIAKLNNDNFVVTWESRYQDGSELGVYGQIFDRNTNKIGSEFQVNTYTSSQQWYTAVASFSNGNFVVIWESWAQDGSEYGIYGQLLDETGTKIGNEFPVNTVIANNQVFPSVTALNDNSFIVTWQSDLQDGASYGIYGQTFRLPSITTTSSTASSRTSTSSSVENSTSSFLNSYLNISSSSTSSNTVNPTISPTTTTPTRLNPPSTNFVSSIIATSESISDSATKNIHTSNSSSNSKIKKWIISAIIGTTLTIIPASILAFFKLKKKKSQNPSTTIEMQNNEPERALDVLPQINALPPSQDSSQESSNDSDPIDEEPIYMDLAQFPGQKDNSTYF